jgi:hypothetical protein
MKINDFRIPFFILILELFSFSSTKAQDVAQPITCTAGVAVSAEPNYYLKEFSDASGTIYFSSSVQQNMIERVNADLTETTNALISFNVPESDEELHAFTFRLFHDRLYAFALLIKTVGEGKIFACEIDKLNLTVIGKPVKVFEYAVSYVEDELTGISTIFPRIETSETGNHLMIFNLQSSGDGKSDYIHAKVFQNDLDDYWEKNITAPFGTSLFSLTDLQLYDSGTLMICGFDIYDKQFSKVAKKEGKANFMYHIITLAEHSENITDRKIDPGNLFIQSFKAGMKEDGGIVGGGIYSSENNDLLNGTFYISFNAKETEPAVFKATPFTVDFMTGEMAESDLVPMTKAVPKGMRNYQLKQIFIQNDGSITMLAEHIFTKGKATSPFICYDDIIVINLNATGNVSWQKRIYKRQEDKNGTAEMFSFFAGTYNNQLLVFFNDAVENPIAANSPVLQPYTTEKKCRMMCMTVNANGDLNKQIVNTFDETMPRPLLHFFIQTDESNFVLYAYGTRKASSIVYGIKIGQ